MGQSYLKNAALLTGADVLLRLAGMGLRIYLANALGGESVLFAERCQLLLEHREELWII